MQIKTLSRLQKCHKRFSKNCLIDSNSQTIELKNFVAMIDVKIIYFLYSLVHNHTMNPNNKMIHSASPLSSNNDSSTK